MKIPPKKTKAIKPKKTINKIKGKPKLKQNTTKLVEPVQTVICNGCNHTFVAEVSKVAAGKAKFCTLSCRTTFTNKRRMAKKYLCKNCAKTYTSKNINTKYCSKRCSDKCSHNKRKLDAEQREKVDILKSRGCEICNWDKASRDIHHLIPVSKGGTNDLTNLITLCPNHHRMADQEKIDLTALVFYIKERIKDIGF